MHSQTQKVFGSLFLASWLFSTTLLADPRADAKQEWHNLISAGKLDQVEKKCSEWLKASTNDLISEGHQCLSSLELRKALKPEMLSPMADEAGGGEIRPGLDFSGINRSIEHLNEAARLTPEDLEVHKGRLFVMFNFGFPSLAPEALEKSLKAVKEKPPIDIWFAYAPIIQERRLYKSGVEYFKVLEKYYPNEPRVVINIGAFYTLLKDDQNALTYSLKAVSMNPKSFNANWNLGRLYDYMQKITEADEYYSKAMSLLPPNEGPRNEFCAYADFLEQKLKNPNKAAEIRKRGCKN